LYRFNGVFEKRVPTNRPDKGEKTAAVGMDKVEKVEKSRISRKSRESRENRKCRKCRKSRKRRISTKSINANHYFTCYYFCLYC
jgi:hypothetical protein